MSNENGRITLAVLSTKLDSLIGTISTLDRRVGSLLDSYAHQEEINRQVSCQIWNGNGNSKIEAATRTAEEAKNWVRWLWLPIGLMIVGGIITGIIKLIIS